MTKHFTFSLFVLLLNTNLFSQDSTNGAMKWYTLGAGKITPTGAKNLNFQFNYSPDFKNYNLTFDYAYHPDFDQKSVAVMLGGRYTNSVLHTGISFGPSLNWYTGKEIKPYSFNPNSLVFGINWIVMLYVRPIPAIMPEIFIGTEYFGQHNEIDQYHGFRFCIVVSNF